MRLNIPVTLLSRKQPRVGDKRKVEKFAILPIRIDDKTVVWFEKYLSVQKYKNVLSTERGDTPNSPKTTQWVEKDRVILN